MRQMCSSLMAGIGEAGHEGGAATVYLGRLSGPRCSNVVEETMVDIYQPPPSETTVPRLNNPEDASVKTAYRGRL